MGIKILISLPKPYPKAPGTILGFLGEGLGFGG